MASGGGSHLGSHLRVLLPFSSRAVCCVTFVYQWWSSYAIDSCFTPLWFVAYVFEMIDDFHLVSFIKVFWAFFFSFLLWCTAATASSFVVVVVVVKRKKKGNILLWFWGRFDQLCLEIEFHSFGSIHLTFTFKLVLMTSFAFQSKRFTPGFFEIHWDSLTLASPISSVIYAMKIIINAVHCYVWLISGGAAVVWMRWCQRGVASSSELQIPPVALDFLPGKDSSLEIFKKIYFFFFRIWLTLIRWYRMNKLAWSNDLPIWFHSVGCACVAALNCPHLICILVNLINVKGTAEQGATD